MIPNLGASQLAYFAITHANKIVAETDIDVIIFYENLQKICLKPECAIMHMNEAWGYDGIMIATTLRNATRLTTFPASKLKIHYMWDIDWGRKPTNKEFSSLHEIYNNKELKTICRSESHSNLLKRCWNVDSIGIVENIDLGEIIKIPEVAICLEQAQN